MSKRWVLVRTKPRREAYAAENVKRQGHQFYLPKFIEQNITKILFPSYLFVWVGEQWMFLKSTYGVATVVQTEEGPRPVPESVIEELRSRENRRGLVELPDDSYCENELLRIKSGPLKDQCGWYKGMSGTKRVSLLLNLLGCVNISVEEVERV